MRIPRPNMTDVVDAIRQLIMGATNVAGTVTLTASATSTTVADPNCDANSRIFLSPRSSTAAAAAPWVSMVGPRQFVLTHGSAGAGAVVDYEIRQDG